MNSTKKGGFTRGLGDDGFRAVGDYRKSNMKWCM